MSIIVDKERKITNELLQLGFNLLTTPEERRDYVTFVKEAERVGFKPLMRSEGWKPPLPEDSSQHFTARAIIDYVVGFVVEYNNSHGGIVMKGESPIDKDLYLRLKDELQKELTK